jgi:hypothetical protein
LIHHFAAEFVERIGSEPMRSKYRADPDVKLTRSNPVSHLRFKSVRVAASSEVSLQKLKTWFTSTAAALNHP